MNHSVRRPRALALTVMLLLATLLSAVLVAFSSATAEAHTPTVSKTCEALAVSTTSYNGNARNTVTVEIDDVVVVDHEVFGASYSDTFEWSPSADHSYVVTIDQGDGTDFDQVFTGTQTACETPDVVTDVTTQPAFADQCGPAYSLTVPEDAAGYTFTTDDSGVVDGEGDIVVTATLRDGFVWTGGGTEPRTWTFEATYEPCIGGAPGVPTVQQLCGPDGDSPVTLPAAGEHFTYVVTDPKTYADGVRIVTVEAVYEAGYTAPEGAETSWTFTLTDEPCVVDAILAPTVQELCGPDGDNPVTVPADGEHHSYVVVDPGTYTDGERVITVEVDFEDGYVAPEGAVTSWSFTVHEQECDTPAAAAASAAVTVTPGTCDAPGAATTTEISNATWTTTDVPAAGGQATFVATANEGAAFDTTLSGVSADGATRTFTVDVPAAGAGCAVTPPAAPPASTPVAPPTASGPSLPVTGFDVTPLLVLGALLAMAGAALVTRRVVAQR